MVKPIPVNKDHHMVLGQTQTFLAPYKMLRERIETAQLIAQTILNRSYQIFSAENLLNQQKTIKITIKGDGLNPKFNHFV